MLLLTRKTSALNFWPMGWLNLEERRSTVIILKSIAMLKWMPRWEKEAFGQSKISLRAHKGISGEIGLTKTFSQL
jgi:hypothetical protein